MLTAVSFSKKEQKLIKVIFSNSSIASASNIVSKQIELSTSLIKSASSELQILSQDPGCQDTITFSEILSSRHYMCSQILWPRDDWRREEYEQLSPEPRDTHNLNTSQLTFLLSLHLALSSRRAASPLPPPWRSRVLLMFLPERTGSRGDLIRLYEW